MQIYLLFYNLFCLQNPIYIFSRSHWICSFIGFLLLVFRNIFNWNRIPDDCFLSIIYQCLEIEFLLAEFSVLYIMASWSPLVSNISVGLVHLKHTIQLIRTPKMQHTTRHLEKKAASKLGIAERKRASKWLLNTEVGVVGKKMPFQWQDHSNYSIRW